MTWSIPDPVSLDHLDWLRRHPYDEVDVAERSAIWPPFDEYELAQWRTWGFSPDEIRQWRKQIVDAMNLVPEEDDSPELYTTLLPMTAATWRGTGIGLTQATAWLSLAQDFPFDVNLPIFAKEWHALGLAPTEGRTWAYELAAVGLFDFDLRDIAVLMNAGWNALATAHFVHVRWLATGEGPARLSDATSWAASGLPIELVLTYARTGISASDIGRAERYRREVTLRGEPWTPSVDLTVTPEQGAQVNVRIADLRRVHGLKPGPWSKPVWPDQRVLRTIRQSMGEPLEPTEWPPADAPSNYPKRQGGVAWPWSTTSGYSKGWAEPPSVPEDHAIPPNMGFLDDGVHLQAIRDYLNESLNLLGANEWCKIAWPPVGNLRSPGAYWEPDEYEEEDDDPPFCSEHENELNDACDECAEVKAETVASGSVEPPAEADPSHDEDNDFDPATWQWHLDVTTYTDDGGSNVESAEDSWQWFETEMHPLAVYYSDAPVR